MASFKQLSRGNWKVQISLGYKDGKKQIVKKQGFKTKKEAEIWANEISNRKNKGYVVPTTNNTLFKDFLNKWFDEHKSKTLSINTYTNYKSRIDTHIIPFLGSYKLTEITNEIIQDFYNKLVNEGLKPSSAKKVLEILNGCFKYAKKLKLIYVLPTDIEKMKLEKPLIEFWSKNEVDYFLNEIKETYLYKPVLIDLLTGLRVGELCGLKWKDIDFDSYSINVSGQVIHDRINKKLIYTPILKTDKSYRNISIPPLLADYLKAIEDEEKPSKNDFIIQDRDGSMCNPRNLSMNFTKTIAKYKKSIEELTELEEDISNYMQLKQITFHGLRHTHATLLILEGENIKVVSDRLGHKDITTTLQTYTHIMDDMKNNTATLLQSMFKNLL